MVQCTVTVAAARATIQKKGVMKALDYFNSRVQLWVSLIGALIFHESEYRGLLVYVLYISWFRGLYAKYKPARRELQKISPEGLRVIFF